MAKRYQDDDGAYYDRTQLRESTHSRVIHRDYLAHCFRYGMVPRFIKSKVTKILDIGCGQDQAVGRLLTRSVATVPYMYCGVDLNKIKKPFKAKWSETYDQFNFVLDYDDIIMDHGYFDLLVCFEVWEHMEQDRGMLLLEAMHNCMKPDGTLLFSTPCYQKSMGMARNHINEVTKSDMEDYLHARNFKIVKQYGTFGSFNHIKKELSETEFANYQALREFYSDEVLACFLAPRFPHASRNVVHVCVRSDHPNNPEEPKFRPSVFDKTRTE